MNDLPAPPIGPSLYAQWRAGDVGAITDRLERRLILELAGEVAGRDVLDIGCGDGELAVDFRRRGAQVAGIDSAPAMIEAARRRAAQEGPDLVFAVAGAAQLPFASGTFDLAAAITILCFVDDAAPVFREVARVLRPGGRLVIGELGRWSSWAATRRLRAWCGSVVWRRARFRTRGELTGLAAAAGLTVETVRGAIFYPRSAVAARLCGGLDGRLGRLTTAGAAFIALTARKR